MQRVCACVHVYVRGLHASQRTAAVNSGDFTEKHNAGAERVSGACGWHRAGIAACALTVRASLRAWCVPVRVLACKGRVRGPVRACERACRCQCLWASLTLLSLSQSLSVLLCGA